MSDPITPLTTRQFVEEAMRRICDDRLALSGSTWQHVIRFFRGNAQRARVAFVTEGLSVEARDEDGTPALVSVPLTVRMTSHTQDAEGDEHAQKCADVIGLCADGTNFPAALNAAMAEDYGDLFNVRYSETSHDAETSVEGKSQITEVKTTLWLPPVESRLAWAAANPQ